MNHYSQYFHLKLKRFPTERTMLSDGGGCVSVFTYRAVKFMPNKSCKIKIVWENKINTSEHWATLMQIWNELKDDALCFILPGIRKCERLPPFATPAARASNKLASSVCPLLVWAPSGGQVKVQRLKDSNHITEAVLKGDSGLWDGEINDLRYLGKANIE